MSLRKVRAAVSRLIGLFQRNRRDRDLSDELQNHLALHIEDNLRRAAVALLLDATRFSPAICLLAALPA